MDGEKTPLIPPSGSQLSSYDHASPASRTSVPASAVASSSQSSGPSSRMSDVSSSVSSTAVASRSMYKVDLDAAVRDNQLKWRHLTEINDDDSTAKSMANEVQHEFAARRQQREAQIQQQQQQLQQDQRPRLSTMQSFTIDGKEYENPLASDPAATSDVDNYLLAAAFIRDGIHGRKIGYRLDRTSLFLHQVFHSDSYRWLYTLVVLVNSSLAFVERPGQQNDYLGVDLGCLVIYGIDVFIRWHMSSDETKRKFRSRQPWAFVRMGLLLVTIIDLVLNLCFPVFNPYRYSRALRPFFLITRRRNVRIIFGSCLRALREVGIVLLLMFALIAFFGLLGYLIFSDISDAVAAPYFYSLSSSLYTMLLIHNCLPYMVKSMYPYFQVTQWSALYFIVFVFLTNLFLSKLTIAVSYKSYKQHTERMLYKKLQKRKAALFAAFEILAQEIQIDAGEATPPSSNDRRGSSRGFVGGIIDQKRTSFSHTVSQVDVVIGKRVFMDSWINACEHLKPQWTSVEATLVFNTVDDAHLGYVDLTQFCELCSLLSVSVERTSSSSSWLLQFFARYVPCVKRNTVKNFRLRLKRMLLHEHVFFGKYPVVVAELVVGALICLSVVQAVQVNNIKLAFSVNSSWRLVGFSLLCLFTFEVVLKLFAFGRREFFSRPFCKLDLSIAVVGWVFYGITSMKDPPQISLVFYDLALAVRSLRILKLLNLFPPFQQILWTMKRIFPLIMQLLIVVFAFMYAFAIFTQANYGLALREFPASKASESPQWYSFRGEFQVDSFEETLVTLFGVANLAGWDIVMDAAHAITGSDATYVFFFSYRIAMSNILLPIFVGFLVESFASNARVVETTIQSRVEVAKSITSAKGKGIAIEDELLPAYSRDSELFGDDEAAKPVPLSPAVSCSSDDEYQIKYERRGSMVNNQMFDTVKVAELSRLHVTIDRKDEEIAVRNRHISQLERNALILTSRLKRMEAQSVAYQSKIDELTKQLQEAEQRSGQLPSLQPTRGPRRPSTKRASSSWALWSGTG
ncbi:TPA: hypothetical protein N0F65_004003 [Lagenidium giganteum]|uniref:Ion transport domain-containing protein n=1 Tax=Lagenidium giganteum TaxID=4803 RepID=A0AAV2Z079_9STRA|nr:TPA: hypothetical protein N0F65_004003 [Lagenidium giganteum]